MGSYNRACKQEVDKKRSNRDFPGDTEVKTSPSKAGGASLIPDWGAKIPHVSGLKIYIYIYIYTYIYTHTHTYIYITEAVL